jgi:hypothetical protein
MSMSKDSLLMCHFSVIKKKKLLSNTTTKTSTKIINSFQLLTLLHKESPIFSSIKPQKRKQYSKNKSSKLLTH